MKNTLTRRTIVKGALIAGLVPAMGLTGRSARAAGLTPLDPNDPMAKGLGFVLDAGKVDAAANATYKSGQQCAICAQFLGKTGDATGGCNIFQGHSVPRGGWCRVWAQKPAA